MAASDNGAGYWMVAADGGSSLYNAPFLGSTGSIRLNKPVVGMAVDPATGGYWLVASDGGIFAYDAPFLGSTGSIVLNRPIEGMGAAPSGTGYRFVASDGGIFAYGSTFYGSAVEPPATTQPPGAAPVCSVSLSWDPPLGERVVITSSVPNYQVLLVKLYAHPPAYVGGFSTDANGQVNLIVKVDTAPIGVPAAIGAWIGPAACVATFVPQ